MRLAGIKTGLKLEVLDEFSSCYGFSTITLLYCQYFLKFSFAYAKTITTFI